MIRKSDGTQERETEQLLEARLRDEIGRLHQMLEREQNARRDAQQDLVRRDAHERELDELATRQFREIKSLRAENAILRAKVSEVEDSNDAQ